MVDVGKKIKQISRGISSFGRMSNRALKKAALRKERLERDMYRVFGPKRPAMSGGAETAQAKAARSIPSRVDTMDGGKDEGTKTERYFGDLDKDKLVSADMDGKDEGVKTDKFFKSKTKGIKPW